MGRGAGGVAVGWLDSQCLQSALQSEAVSRIP